MLKSKNLILATLLSFFSLASTSASAVGGLFAEPILTYETGNSTIDSPTFNSSSGTVNGVGIGGRIGFHLSEIIFLAADLRYAKPTYKNSANNMDSTSTSFNHGPVVGIQTPLIGLRVWGSYILGGELNPEESNNVDLKFAGAQGYRVGAGLQLILLSLNLEYQDLSYGSTTVEKFGPFAVNASDNTSLKNKSYIVSVSFPLEF